MFEDYNKTRVTFYELDNLDLPDGEPLLLEVLDDNVKYEFLIRINRKFKGLLVLGPGAFKPSEMSLPVFQRHSWIDDLEESVIFYNDPTLYLGKLMLGWGFGELDTYYLKKIASVVEYLKDVTGYKSEDTYFFGSSAGGFMSLMLASMSRNSTAIVNNPQTIFTNYDEGPVNKLFNILNISREHAEQEYGERISVIKSFKKYKHIPKVYYLQNVLAKKDIEKQLIPFLNELKEMDLDSTNHIKVDLYFNQNLGHNPVGKKQTINYIKNVMYNS